MGKEFSGAVAQSVEQRTENPCVGGSIPPHTTKPLSSGAFSFLIAENHINWNTNFPSLIVLLTYIAEEMDIETLRTFCLSFEDVTEGFPFGTDPLVFKVAHKIFLLASLDEQPLRINIKCQPEKAIELRETYEAIIPGYHMNKKHWNTILLDGSLKRQQVEAMIRDSYDLVSTSLPKKSRKNHQPNK